MGIFLLNFQRLCARLFPRLRLRALMTAILFIGNPTFLRHVTFYKKCYVENIYNIWKYSAATPKCWAQTTSKI
jgi:hypothetical protein